MPALLRLIAAGRYFSIRAISSSRHIIATGEWERPVESAILSRLRPGAVVVEVGSNHGYHTLAMCEAIGDAGRLYGFEANPVLFRLLRWTVDINGFSARCVLNNVAVGDRTGVAKFCFSHEEISRGHLGENDEESFVNQNVPMTTLDITLSDVGQVDFLRMDAEGSEAMILTGAIELLDQSPGITIVTEWNPDFIRARGSDPNKMIALLSERGFIPHLIDGDGALVALSPGELLDVGHSELLFSRNSATP